MDWPQFLLAVLMIVVCGLLMLVILLQRGRGGGLAGAFGGGGGSSAFGAKTGDVLTWITVAVAAVFLLLAVVNNFAFDKSPIAPPEPTITIGEVPELPSTVPGGDPGSALPIQVVPVTPPTGAVTPSGSDGAAGAPTGAEPGDTATGDSTAVEGQAEGSEAAAPETTPPPAGSPAAEGGGSETPQEDPPSP